MARMVFRHSAKAICLTRFRLIVAVRNWKGVNYGNEEVLLMDMFFLSGAFIAGGSRPQSLLAGNWSTPAADRNKLDHEILARVWVHKTLTTSGLRKHVDTASVRMLQGLSPDWPTPSSPNRCSCFSGPRVPQAWADDGRWLEQIKNIYIYIYIYIYSR